MEEEQHKTGKRRKGWKKILKWRRTKFLKEIRGIGNVHTCSYTEVTDR
jgi:hypothetical protein